MSNEMAATDGVEQVPELYSQAWCLRYDDILAFGEASGQAMMAFYLSSFPGVEESFLASLEHAVSAGDLDALTQAAALGLPMDSLPRLPLAGCSMDESGVTFSPMDLAIEHGHQALVEALATDEKFRRCIHPHYLSEKAIETLVQQRQTRAIAALYKSDLLTNAFLSSLTKNIVASLDSDLWKAAGERFFEFKEQGESKHVTILKLSLFAANESLFDACVQRGDRPWQVKIKVLDLDVTWTAFEQLIIGRDAVLKVSEGTRLDREDLARRTSIAQKLTALGFGPEVTNLEGRNAAHEAAAWRVPDLLEVALHLHPDLQKPSKFGGYPLHDVASNISRETTEAVLYELLGSFKRHGANLDCRDFEGNNAAEVAISNQMGSVLEAMVASGVPLHSRNHCDQPPIEAMFRVGQPFSKRGSFMASCMRAGLDVNTVLSTGKTFMDTMLENPKRWNEAINTVRAFRARSSAMDLIAEMDQEPKASVSP